MGKSDDWLPTNPEEFAAWLDNFDTKLPSFAEKYGISEAILTQLSADNAWTQYWVPAKDSTERQKTQVNSYYDTITKEPDAEQPSDPTLSLPAGKPTPVPPGMRRRIRDIASFIKGNKAVYAVADGKLLGIELPESSDAIVGSPEFDLSNKSNFALGVKFGKNGHGAVRFEFRRKGEDAWTFINNLTTSPGELHINPKVAGTAEQIEIRAIFLDKDQPVGEYSDIKVVTIAP